MAFARGGLRRAKPVAVAGPGFAELFGALPVATLVIDPDGRIARANAACESLLNHSEKSMIGQPYDAVLMPPDDYADRREQHFEARPADGRRLRPSQAAARERHGA